MSVCYLFANQTARTCASQTPASRALIVCVCVRCISALCAPFSPVRVYVPPARVPPHTHTNAAAVSAVCSPSQPKTLSLWIIRTYECAPPSSSKLLCKANPDRAHAQIRPDYCQQQRADSTRLIYNLTASARQAIEPRSPRRSPTKCCSRPIRPPRHSITPSVVRPIGKRSPGSQPSSARTVTGPQQSCSSRTMSATDSHSSATAWT